MLLFVSTAITKLNVIGKSCLVMLAAKYNPNFSLESDGR